jgi:DNA-binding IclR family transcriptional regulator
VQQPSNKPLPRPLSEVLRSASDKLGAFVARGNSSITAQRFAELTNLPPAAVRLVLSDLAVQGLIRCEPSFENPASISVTELGMERWRRPA